MRLMNDRQSQTGLDFDHETSFILELIEQCPEELGCGR